MKPNVKRVVGVLFVSLSVLLANAATDTEKELRDKTVDGVSAEWEGSGISVSYTIKGSSKARMLQASELIVSASVLECITDGVLSQVDAPVARPRNVSVKVAGESEGRGTVAKLAKSVVMSGSKVALKATPTNGSVFAGWYLDDDCNEPIEDVSDYRAASVNAVVPDRDVTFVARFVSSAEDTNVVFNCGNEIWIEGSREYDLLCESLSVPTIKATGLPAGIKVNGAKLSVADAAKVKPGIYPVLFSAVNQSKVSTSIDMKIYVPMKDGVLVDVANDDTDDDGRLMGNVSGMGYVKPGGKVTLKATPKKGYVFAGWVDLPTGMAVDPRNPSLSFVLPQGASDMSLSARFLPISEDWLDVDEWNFPEAAEVGGNITYAFTSGGAGASAFSSGSLVSLKVTGLPTGLKYDTKTMTVSGAPTKKGVYYPVFSATNASGYKFDKVSRISVGGADDGDFDDISEEYDVDFDDLSKLTLGEEVYLYLGYHNEDVGLAATGLPKGLSLISANDDYYCICIGTPSKVGAYVVKFTSKESCCGMGKRNAQKTVVVDGAPSRYLKVLAGAGGTVSGEGVYHAGSTAKATAKPQSGYVFAGWYCDTGFERPIRSDMGYRQVVLSQIVNCGMEEEPVARFVTKAEDVGCGIAVRGFDEQAGAERDDWLLEDAESRYLLAVNSLSCPSVTVKGLPAGVELAKEVSWANLPNGDEVECFVLQVKDASKLKPGNYSAVVTVSNQSKCLATKTIRIIIPNVRNEIFEDVDYSENGNRILVNGTCWMEIGFYAESLYDKVTVTGLPAGMKMNSPNSTFNDIRSIYFTGTPTKAGSYTVSVKVQKSSGTYAITFTINVDPLPSWLIGTYGGAGALQYQPNGWSSATLDKSTYGMHSFTVSDKGKVSGKMVMRDANASFTAGLTNPTYSDDGSLVSIETDYTRVKVNGRNRSFCYRITREEGLAGSWFGSVQLKTYDEIGCPKGVTGVLAQNLWLRKDLVLPNLKDLTCELADEGLAMKFDASGNVAVAGKVNGKSVSVAVPLVLEAGDLDADGFGEMALSAYVCFPKSDVRFKCLFDISVSEGGIEIRSVQKVGFDDFTQEQ